MQRSLGTFLRHLRRGLEANQARGLDDAQLLERFVRDREEAAFEVLVWRHAPMVLGVCRRVLRDEQDAEDAFQATFLALVRKAGSIGRREALGSWLYKVAYRVALRSRGQVWARGQRHDVERLGADPGPEPGAEELRRVLDEEVGRLPARHRAAFVLCYLEGRTQEAAARQLGCAPGTVAWRLAWARRRLRARLERRGLGPAAGALATAPAALAAPPAPLVETTVQVALAFAGGQAMTAPAVALAEGALRVMAMNKLKLAAAVLLAASLFGAGAGLFAWQAPADKPAAPARPELAADRVSVRLPAEAVSRLGVRVVAVKPREAPPRRLELAGSLAIRPDRLFKVRAPLAPCGVLALGSAEEMGGKKRPLWVGDVVKKGQVLAVLWNKELGMEKGELLDRLVQLRLDEQILERAEKAYAEGAVPEAFVLNARRTVQAGRNAIARRRRILLAAGIDAAEIKALEDEAKGRPAGKAKRDLAKQKADLERWGRVGVRAPIDGVIVEKNVAVGEVVVDKTANLFQLADLSKLTVLANVAESDLPALLTLQARHHPRPVPWQVRLAAGKDAAPLKSEGLERVSPIVDPNSSTSVVSGVVDNPAGLLHAGQLVRVTILLPAPPGEVVVPTSALVEGGAASYVMVQADPKKPVFTQRRVVVVRRGRDLAHVRAEPTAKEKRGGAEPLRPGERVVTEGALELKAALDDLRGKGP
jgi:RND family efflux transporter MFP subunit